MINGSGDGGLSYTYILNTKTEHIDRAITWAIYQVNTMKYVAAMAQPTKTTVFIIIFIFVVIKIDYNDCQQWC